MKLIKYTNMRELDKFIRFLFIEFQNKLDQLAQIMHKTSVLLVIMIITLKLQISLKKTIFFCSWTHSALRAVCFLTGYHKLLNGTAEKPGG